MDFNDDEEETETEEEDYEPQITSNNPAERKLARKLRIQRRAEAIKKQELEMEQQLLSELLGTAAGPKQPEITKNAIELQIERSNDLLQRLIIEGDDHVTNVRIANEARETDRRERVGIGKEKLLDDLDEEANSAQQMFNEIADKWIGILKYNDPLHINDEIVAQKTKCDELIREKDEMIANLREELKKADINFSRDQRKQCEDINSLARRIENQVILMRNAYRNELENIEDVIMAERQLLIEANNKKWDELAKRRDLEEKSNAEKKTEEYWNFVKEMEDLNRDFQELYRATNIALENDCDELQRELEKIKVDALWNGEKLDYNYQILKKREDENMIIRSQQKRRINKLQDYINGLRNKTNDYKKKTSLQIEKLTSEVNNLRRNILDLEMKSEITAKSNDRKFHAIWKMNQEKADCLLRKVIDIDRILHEQQLGNTWKGMTLRLLELNDLESYRAALKSPTTQIVGQKAAAMANSLKAPESSVSEKCSDSEASQQGENRNYRRILKNILSLIADKTEFLLEDQLKSILKPYIEEEKALIKVDNVFSALNVTEKGDIDVLLMTFLPFMYCPICTVPTIRDLRDDHVAISTAAFNVQEVEAKDSEVMLVSQDVEPIRSKIETSMEMFSQVGLELDPATATIDMGPMTVTLFDIGLEGECRGPGVDDDDKIQEEDEGSNPSYFAERTSCQYNHPLVISSVYVLKALKDFLEKYHVVEEARGATISNMMERRKDTLSRLISAKDIETFWKRYMLVFPADKEELWDHLLVGLKKYYDILKARKSVSEEVVELRRINTEIRKLFTKYVDKKPLPY